MSGREVFTEDLTWRKNAQWTYNAQTAEMARAF